MRKSKFGAEEAARASSGGSIDRRREKRNREERQANVNIRRNVCRLWERRSGKKVVKKAKVEFFLPFTD